MDDEIGEDQNEHVYSHSWRKQVETTINWIKEKKKRK